MKITSRGKKTPGECFRNARKATHAEMQWMNTDVAKHQRNI